MCLYYKVTFTYWEQKIRQKLFLSTFVISQQRKLKANPIFLHNNTSGLHAAMDDNGYAIIFTECPATALTFMQ